MLERIIPVSGEALPAIGLGSWIQFDVGKTSPEKENLLEVLKLLHKSGGKLIDSSPMYGRSEEVIGELTSETDFRDELFYATKVWITGRENGIKQMHESIKKMKRNKMDLIQVHNLKDWETHIATLNDWKKDGLVRYTGVTHYRDSAHEDLEAVVRSKSVDFVQFNYSILSVNAEKRLLPACRDNGVAAIINEPLEKGSLFKMVKGKEIPAFAKEMQIKNWAAFFLKYILGEPAVTCIIPGTSEPVHMKQILSAGVGPVPDEKMRKEMREWMLQTGDH
jgi:diketogulonate reductase-like aldo/keto reductase